MDPAGPAASPGPESPPPLRPSGFQRLKRILLGKPKDLEDPQLFRHISLAAFAILVVLNLRGVKESVKTLTPIFLVFIVTHAIVIAAGIGLHLGRVHEVATEVSTGLSRGLSTMGFTGLALLFLRAYSLGGGTYTGIEAVSNGLQLMPEPRVQPAKGTRAS